MNLKLKKTLIERAEAKRRAEKDERDYLQERFFSGSTYNPRVISASEGYGGAGGSM